MRSRPGLRRAIGPGLLTVFVVGDILGAGIYALVGEVAAEVGGAIWTSFLAAFVLAAFTAFVYAELVSKYPRAAGAALSTSSTWGCRGSVAAMPERTQHAPGTFSWVDLATSDAEGAKAFYSELLGWELEDLPLPDGGAYTMVLKRGKRAGALGPAQPGQPTAWNSYVTVESADDAAAKAGELGAQILAEPFDVMEAGRMATLQDPNGAVLSVWQPRETFGAEIVNEPGSLTMNQLNTSNPERSQEFYEGLFGWRFERIPEAEPPYWGVYNGDRLNAGMLPQPPDGWLVYLATEDVDADAPRIGELGGNVVVEPVSIPAGRFLVATDPQGAFFALFSGQFDD